MNIQRKNSAHHFRMQSEREQTLGMKFKFKFAQVYASTKVISTILLQESVNIENTLQLETYKAALPIPKWWR